MAPMETQAKPARGATIRLRLIAVFCWIATLGLTGLAALYGFLAAGAPGIPSLTAAAAAQDRGALGLSAFVFVAAALGFACCGWAAARQRRWLPSILRSVGWIWLLAGVMFLLLTFGMLDGMVATALADSTAPPEIALIAKLGVLVTVAFGGILMPGLLLLLCSGKALAEFCRNSGDSPSWTDGVPEPVLGLSFAMALAALMILPTVVTARIPIGPQVVSGPAAVAAGLLMFGLLALSAFWTFRLRIAGWWLTLGLILGLGVSALWTLNGMSVIDLLRAMGYPEQSIAALSGLGEEWLVGCTVGITLIGVGQLLWVRRHFRTAA